MRRAISYWIYILFVLIFVSACGGNKQHSSENVLNDFDSICQRGELRVLTLYSSTSYFIYRGEEMGYEYERIKQFADHYHLKTKSSSLTISSASPKCCKKARVIL